MTIVSDIKSIIPRSLKNIAHRAVDIFAWDEWSTRSWSQEGEDLVLRRIFDSTRTGFYVDVGAHHPKRFSNTYYFYRSGWRGINIDAMPGSMALFKKIRPRDINLEVGIGQENNYLRYYVFNDTALNGFSAELSRQYINERKRIRIEKVIEVEVLPLREILSRYFARDFCKIDFMTVDVEGFDLQVLSSNDWSLYRPTYVLAEALRSSLDSFEADPLAKFMREQGYAVFSKQVNTVFFRDTSS